MKKVWSYIAVFFIGISVGLVAMYKLMGEQIKIEVRKVKNKRTSGQTTTTIPINIKRLNDVKKSRLDRRYERRQGRIIKRNRKKQKKALEKL